MTEIPSLLSGPEAEIPAEIKGLIFDLDGTLIDTMPIHFRAWQQIMLTADITLAEERFYTMAGMPTRRIVEILGQEQSKPVDVEKLAHEKEEIFLAMMPEAPPILQVINLARREKGKRGLAVASGGWRRIILRSLKVIHCEDLFDTIVGADEVEHGKPHPDMFLEAANRLKLPPEACLVFEDAPAGFEAAKAAGMKMVDVRPWYLPRKK